MQESTKKGFFMGLSKRTVIILAIILGPALIALAGQIMLSGGFLIAIVVFLIIRHKKNKEEEIQVTEDSKEYVLDNQDIDYFNTLTESTDFKCLAKYGEVLNRYKERGDKERYERYHEFMTSFVPYRSEHQLGIDSLDYIGGKKVYAFFTDKDLDAGNFTKPNVICVCDDYTRNYWLDGDERVVVKTDLLQYGHMYVRGISTSESNRALAQRLCKLYPGVNVGYLKVTGGYVDGMFGLRQATAEEEKYLTHLDMYSVVDFYLVSKND